MPGKMILHYNHGQTKVEEYQTPEHAKIIVRRWSLNHSLPGREHYITIIPEIDGVECENDKEVRGEDSCAIIETSGKTF